jgi:hypothetical protein
VRWTENAQHVMQQARHPLSFFPPFFLTGTAPTTAERRTKGEFPFRRTREFSHSSFPEHYQKAMLVIFPSPKPQKPSRCNPVSAAGLAQNWTDCCFPETGIARCVSWASSEIGSLVRPFKGTHRSLDYQDEDDALKNWRVCAVPRLFVSQE